MGRSCVSSWPYGAVEQATKNKNHVDLTAEVTEAPAEKAAKQLALQRSATLQRQIPTELGLTPVESCPITELDYENSDNKLEHHC